MIKSTKSLDLSHNLEIKLSFIESGLVFDLNKRKIIIILKNEKRNNINTILIIWLN